MTLPTRPAPAPPGSRAQTAAANANASLEQLRLQLQQQQQMQRQNVTVPKLTIKLPPPPKGPQQQQQQHSAFAANNNANVGGSNITRKFPQARYAPATNWDDSPFDLLGQDSGGSGSSSINNNSTYKKPPPPRPPPPKIQPKKTTAPAAPTTGQHSTNILSNIFHRNKKTSRAPTPNSAARVYGAAAYGSTNNISSASTTTTGTSQLPTFNQNTWNNAWNNTPNSVTNHQSSSSATTEGQLISFDSPPSSPTFTQKSNSDCLSVDSFSSDSNFSSPNNGSVSQPESGFEDDFSAAGRSRPPTTSPLDPWETMEAFAAGDSVLTTTTQQARYGTIGTAPVRNLNVLNARPHSNNSSSGDNPLCNGKSLLPPSPALNMPTIIKPKISQKPKAPKPPSFIHTNGGVPSLYGDSLSTPPSPPMPQCAPPPPPGSGAAPANGPSLLDVISGKADAMQLYSANSALNSTVVSDQPYGIALYDFDSTEEGDLCFRENEKIYLVEKVSEDWYKGRTRSGCEGIFPINYVDIKVPLAAAEHTKAVAAAATTPVVYSSSTTHTYESEAYQSSTTYTSNSNELKVKCLYNFPAEVQGDLELRENDMVTVLYRINEDWLYGEVHGRQGQFPANFLEYVPSNIPMP